MWQMRQKLPVPKANEQTYACDTEPTRSEYLSSTCNTQAIVANKSVLKIVSRLWNWSNWYS